MTESTNNILPFDLHEYSVTQKKSLLEDLPTLNKNKRIKLRARHVPTKTSKNHQSLYLDVHKAGNRERRYLKIYVDLKKNTKRKDKEAFKLAIELRDNLELELFQNEQDFALTNHKRKINFVDYFKNLVDKRNTSVKPWRNTYNYLHRFTKGSILFHQVDEIFCDNFKEYLLENVSQNSAHTYFARLKASLNYAIREKIIKQSPAQFITVKKEDVERDFLTVEELKKLKNTPCKNEQTKIAFLFTCFTGLRYSDIYKLTFEQIQDGFLVYKQIKTKSPERLKLSKNALDIIEQQKAEGKNIEKIFDLQSHTNTQLHIKSWILKAGIKKNITWHSGRHTFATLALTYGSDLYTVSKLLGHREIKATQIYAKLIDKKKDEAIDRLPKI